MSDEFVNVERRPRLIVLFEIRADAVDHGARAMAIGGDPLESLLGLVEIGRRPVEKTITRIGARDDGSQRLLYLVRDRRRDRVSRHPPGLAFATLPEHNAEKPPVQRRYLIQQDHEDDTA